MAEKYPSELAEKIVVRLPDGMRGRLTEAAKENRRSVNAEVVAALERWLSDQGGSSTPEALPVVKLDIDTKGLPISWQEIHEHVRALARAAKLNMVEMRVQVFTPMLLSTTGRDKEAAALTEQYAKGARKGRR